MLSQLLEKYHVKYEDLNSAERETLNTWLSALSNKTLTLENVKEYIKNLITAVEKELADVKETTSLWSFLTNRKKDIFLKARLKNYLILQDFLTAPDKAQKHIEQSLNNLNKS